MCDNLQERFSEYDCRTSTEKINTKIVEIERKIKEQQEIIQLLERLYENFASKMGVNNENK
jgi:uncharacterized protein YeeX (DUF496 family)